MPQTKARSPLEPFNNTSSTVLEQELFPISITITGNVAVAQYHYQVARENYKKDRETVTAATRTSSSRRAGRWLLPRVGRRRRPQEIGIWFTRLA